VNVVLDEVEADQAMLAALLEYSLDVHQQRPVLTGYFSDRRIDSRDTAIWRSVRVTCLLISASRVVPSGESVICFGQKKLCFGVAWGQTRRELQACSGRLEIAVVQLLLTCDKRLGPLPLSVVIEPHIHRRGLGTPIAQVGRHRREHDVDAGCPRASD